MPTKIILDMDVGVDDSLAILLALRSPELEILGITAVAGNAPLENTANNTLRVLEAAGRTDIPVARGRPSLSSVSPKPRSTFTAMTASAVRPCLSPHR